MHDAGCGDELVGRITLEIQSGRGYRDRHVDGPYVESTEDSGNVPVLKIQLYATKLEKLRQLPEHDRGNGPSLPRQRGLFVWPEVTAESEDQDVRIKIQHPRSNVHRCS